MRKHEDEEEQKKKMPFQQEDDKSISSNLISFGRDQILQSHHIAC